MNIITTLGIGRFAGCVVSVGIIVFVGVKWARELAARRRKRHEDPRAIAVYNPKPFRRRR